MAGLWRRWHTGTPSSGTLPLTPVSLSVPPRAQREAASLRVELEQARLSLASQSAQLRALEQDLERAMQDKAEANRLRRGGLGWVCAYRRGRMGWRGVCAEFLQTRGRPGRHHAPHAPVSSGRIHDRGCPCHDRCRIEVEGQLHRGRLDHIVEASRMRALSRHSPSPPRGVNASTLGMTHGATPGPLARFLEGPFGSAATPGAGQSRVTYPTSPSLF